MERKFGKLFSSVMKMSLFLVVVMLIALPSSALAGDPKIKTMTRNLYLGADIFKVVEAAMTDPNLIPDAVEVVFEDMQNSNFPERAEALADEIALFEPDVVGLQEVSRYLKTIPGQDTELVIDFYSVLDAALKERGMDYTAFINTNADITMPMTDESSPYGISYVTMTDHDVILVREDHSASNEYKINYQYQLELDVGTTSLAFTRGFISVDVNIKGDDFRFVNTHLEVRDKVGSVYRVFQAAQMQELLATVGVLEGYFGTKPVVMVGDFNSSPTDIPGESWVPNPDYDPEDPASPPYILVQYVPPYMMAVGSGYKDAWLERKNQKCSDGFTSGFDEYVSDPAAELTSRIDLIFVDEKDLEIDKVNAKVVGNKVEDMTPSGLWPSDHAGVKAKIKFDN